MQFKTLVSSFLYLHILSEERKSGILAVSNACQEALNEADFVTISNEENAIAKVIDDLPKKKYI